MKYKDNYESSQINVNILHKGLYSKNTNIKLRESHVDADQGYNLFEYLYDSIHVFGQKLGNFVP